MLWVGFTASGSRCPQSVQGTMKAEDYEGSVSSKGLKYKCAAVNISLYRRDAVSFW